MEHYKISKLLNDSSISKFMTKNVSKLMNYQVVNILLTKILGINLQCEDQIYVIIVMCCRY